MDWVLLVTSAISAGVVTNLSGWLLSALKDGQIDKYEWLKGLWTLLFSLVVTGSLVFTGMNPIQAAAWSVPIHMIIKALGDKAGLPAD